MSIDPTQILAGAAAGALAGQAVDRAKDKVQEGAAWAGGNRGAGAPDDATAMIIHLLHNIHVALRKQQEMDCPERDSVILLQPQSTYGDPYVVTRSGAKHLSLLTSAAFNVIVMTPVGSVTFAMSQGWNALDVPERSLVYTASGTPTKVLLRYADYSLDIAGV